MTPAASEGYVSAEAQAHAQGLLVIWEAAKLLDMRVLDLAEDMAAGRIEPAARCNNLPCFSLQAIDAYRRSRVA
ncbi:MAG: hypothetical protein ACRDZ3_18170 [Acidimicrobiia bacterium]